VSMLCICIVFLPVLLLSGAAKYLFTPMALAVVFSILASYGLSRTLVPVMSQHLLREHEYGEGRGAMARLHRVVEAKFERLRRNYLAALRWALASRATVFGLFIVLVIGSAAAVLFIGWEFFPVVDAGQIRLHVNAPAGTRIEETGVIFSRVEEQIRRTIEPKDLDVIIDNIGIPPSTNLAYSDNVTLSSGDGEILVSLKSDHEVATSFRNSFPSVRFTSSLAT
jgi:multidrug efflux pump subunit AcrB